MANNWTREQLLIALGLYCELPFGQFHQKHPKIIQAAESIGRTPSALAMKLSNLASLDPVITESGRSGLPGASVGDREIWEEFSSHTAQMMAEIEGALEQYQVNPEAYGLQDDEVGEAADYSASNVESKVKRRKGQNLFRDAVLSAYDFQCAVTGVCDARLLVASHIKPWSEDEENRLNPSNGLCLSTFYDRAFDIGLISFSDDFDLILSEELKAQAENAHIRETFFAREGNKLMLPDKFSPDPGFLAWHREQRFRA